MNWNETYPITNQPTMEQIAEAVGNPLWARLCGEVERAYGGLPRVEYSRCSMAPGWNVKYKKGGRAVCTLYPDCGGFRCMVVVSDRVQNEAEFLLLDADPYTRELYRNTPSGMGGRWLMIDVSGEAILRDTLRLIVLRTSAKSKN